MFIICSLIILYSFVVFFLVGFIELAFEIGDKPNLNFNGDCSKKRNYEMFWARF